tara:strand:+ start:1332 stop:1892 length:561 start_codon:yes stop_codon:yes gene_type:complete
MTTNNNYYIGFGSGIKLLSEDWYIKEFKPELTKRAFRSFCRALKVPMIEIGRTKFIEMNSFQLALKAITRVGGEDFYVSGCASIATGKHKISKLDSDYVAKNLEPLLCELLACKSMTGDLVNEVKTSIKQTAARMARAGISTLPEELQEKYSKRAIRVFGGEVSKPKGILNIYDEKTNKESDTGTD